MKKRSCAAAEAVALGSPTKHAGKQWTFFFFRVSGAQKRAVRRGGTPPGNGRAEGAPGAEKRRFNTGGSSRKN